MERWLLVIGAAVYDHLPPCTPLSGCATRLRNPIRIPKASLPYPSSLMGPPSSSGGLGWYCQQPPRLALALTVHATFHPRVCSDAFLCCSDSKARRSAGRSAHL